ncbi:S-layer homology domain-containing protein, partial [Candidatus Peregrinibacteria bacterium]|nr:S-layer homology domain-containing protein [Candidatus Peregrinibacteria bacterium]
PDLPTITLPDLIPGLKIEIPGFEVPEFPELIMPVLPDLPPLSIPQLPDLPRPPKIPPISDLVADVAANLRPIFTILCLLKNGLIPVPEAGLAAEIETLTQPGIQAIIPILKHLAVQLPPIQYDYVKEMRLNAQLRFDIDTTGIVEAVQAGAKIWNKEVGDIVKAINRLLAIPYGEMLSQAIELAIKKAEEEGLKYIEEEAGDAVENLKPVLLDDGGRNSSFTPEYSTDDYGVKQQYDALNRTLSEFINNLETDAGYPDKFYLTATETLLDRDDPILNKPLGENIALGDLPNDPYIRRLADLRNSLFSYAKNLNENNDLLAQIDDYNDFTKALADGDESLKIAAALTGTDVAGVQRENDFPAGQKNLNMSFLGENVERKLLAQADNTFGDQRLLAAEIADDYTATFVPKGFFIVADGVNENVLGYTLELGKNMQSIFNDVDRDEDADIIFSMGGDVYLKENRTNKPDLPAGNFIISFDKNTVSDYAKNAPVENLSVPYTGSGKVDLNWQPKPGAVSYEVKIRKSLNDDISDAVVDMDTTATKISLQLQNGNYYAKIFAVDNDGNRSMASDDIILSPQSCADKEPPFAAVEDSYDVSILKDLEIDTKNSFDADGEIVEYYMEEMSSGRILWSDKDLSNDSDGDGNAANDRNNTVFRIGPFTKKEDIGIHKYILHLIDQSGNSSSTEMAVNVFAPQISLNDTFARTGIATGATEAAVSELPFSMMRERLIYRLPEESLKVVPRLEKAAEGITDADGSYTLDNFNSENLIFVENAAGKVVAKIQPSTGNIGELADGYSTRVNEAYPPFKATNVEIMSAGGDVMATVYLVSNGNVDVHINSPASGVNVTDFQGDEYKFVSLPANDRSYPGGAMLVGGGKNPLLAVDTSGNILILDEGVTLRRKNNDLRNDPLTIEVRIGGDTAGEIFVNPFRDGASVVGPKDIPAATPVGPSEAAIYGSYPFDFNSETATFVNRDQTVSREEFVRMVLNMLCIIPRKEAYQNFAAGSGYSDIEFKTGDENFAYIKEATMLGLVEGYKGEAYENGLLPFKPENPVSRAEAVKIILEAMELQNLISLENVSEGSPWYEPFMRLAGDVNGKFIITDEEARDAEKELKYGALVTMAERVLTISDCVKIDKDRDGMSDYCEAKYEIDDPLKDEDGDGLQNKDECFYGLNPKDSDTDNGGTSDGQEINFGTNPRHRADDPEDNDEDGLSDSAEILIYGTNPNDEDSDDGGTDDGQEAVNLTDPLDGLDDGKRGKRNSGEDGIYIVPAKCDTCPCVSTLIDSAEVVEGDKFFPVIGTFGEDGKDDGKVDIFSKGNEVIIEEIQ